eukprot:12357127-Alexandrium_andersonii.AAC.1
MQRPLSQRWLWGASHKCLRKRWFCHQFRWGCCDGGTLHVQHYSAARAARRNAHALAQLPVHKCAAQ